MLILLFNPFCALISAGLGKWRSAPWFGHGLLLSLGASRLAAPYCVTTDG